MRIRLQNINKPAMSGHGTMSGRQALGITRGAGPNLCQECVSRTARVRMETTSGPIRLCNPCARGYR